MTEQKVETWQVAEQAVDDSVCYRVNVSRKGEHLFTTTIDGTDLEDDTDLEAAIELLKEIESAVLYQRVRDALLPCLAPHAVVLSFGWNTVGMGKGRGFEQVEIMLVCHGGAHNDTICLAEQRLT